MNFELFEETINQFVGSSFFDNTNVINLSNIEGLNAVEIRKSKEGLELLNKFYDITISHNSDYINDLSGNQREQRAEIRTHLRKLFLEKDKCNIYKGLNLMLPKADDQKFVIDIIKKPMGIQLGLCDGDVPDDFVYDVELGGEKIIIDKEYLSYKSFNSFQVYNLFLYGSHLHQDPKKEILYNALVKRFGKDLIYLYVDTHIVILYQLFVDLINGLVINYKEFNK
jgi:hypothetical protein